MTPTPAPLKDEILRASSALFSERGYHGTSVRDIAERVGLQGGSLYAHIAGKEELLFDIVNRAADQFFAAIKPIVASERDAMQKLRQAIIAHVEVVAGDVEAAAVYTVEWRHLSADQKKAVTARRDEYEKQFRKLISDAIQERYVTATDPAGATLFILSSLNYVFTWYRPRPGGKSPAEVGKMLSDYIFEGLKRRAAVS